MEPKVLLPYSQQPASGLHPEPAQFIHTSTLYFKVHVSAVLPSTTRSSMWSVTFKFSD